VNADASFASNPDETSQLGFVNFQADKHDNCQPVVWASCKAKRVTRSVLGAETVALADGFDAAYSGLMRHIRLNTTAKAIVSAPSTDLVTRSAL
jgi:hypothetical protein